jgi:nucleoside-diphosphate-sugar epimerase
MRIFVAGATGALGRRLVPQLVAAGHEVTGMTRTAAKADALRAQGATPVVADALDRDAVLAAVHEARPDVVVHQLTAIGKIDLRNPDRTFAPTNRLRTQGTDILLAAAREVGASRFVAQSYAGWPFARDGAEVKTEEDALDPEPPAGLRETHAAIRHLERAVTTAQGIDGIVLRYGGFYGPGTGMAKGGDEYEAVRKRQFPVVGGGRGIWSLIHIDDAAEATVAAIEHGAPGIYNVVDDEPAPVREWLPALAAAVGGKPPRKVPRFVGRLLMSPGTLAMMTEIRGASNAKARRELGWHPAHSSWRQGFQAL